MCPAPCSWRASTCRTVEPARERVVDRQDRAARNAEADVDSLRLERAEDRVGSEHLHRVDHLAAVVGQLYPSPDGSSAARTHCRPVVGRRLRRQRRVCSRCPLAGDDDDRRRRRRARVERRARRARRSGPPRAEKRVCRNGSRPLLKCGRAGVRVKPDGLHLTLGPSVPKSLPPAWPARTRTRSIARRSASRGPSAR